MTDLFFILVESGLGICSFAHFLLCPGANQSCCSSLICSFVKSDLSDWLPHSLHKSNREQFAQVAHDKRVAEAVRSFSRAHCSFALSLTKTSEEYHKKLMSEFPTL